MGEVFNICTYSIYDTINNATIERIDMQHVKLN